MSPEVFLDTSFVVALTVESDAHHTASLLLSEEIASSRTRLVTTSAVLLEVGNALAKLRFRRSCSNR